MIYRAEKTGNFTSFINSETFLNKNLGVYARVVLMAMLSRPDDWNFNIAGIATITGISRSAVANAMKELEAAGHLVRRQGRCGGRFTSVEYDVYEEAVNVNDEACVYRPEEEEEYVPSEEKGQESPEDKMRGYHAFMKLYPPCDPVHAVTALKMWLQSDAPRKPVFDALKRAIASDEWQLFVPEPDVWLAQLKREGRS